ncbi:MAG TPA: zinc-dependent metalloprotease, partial [Oryzihumus sp.]|nr:zinc-dependent metalloprotease [Oryzihumus sp.]
TVEQIRVKFQRRREGTGSIDRLLRRLLGLEAKMRQYRDGATFVRAVTDRVGVDGFNTVWTSPETLPKPAEIEDPQAWVTRVHG